MKLQNHYKDGFFDVCAEYGFLPVKDPIVSLPSTYADVQKILDDMPVVLPNGEHGLLHHEGESSNDTAQKIRERNIQSLPTKRKLLEGQLALIHNNDFTAESVFELNKAYGYVDSEHIN